MEGGVIQLWLVLFEAEAGQRWMWLSMMY